MKKGDLYDLGLKILGLTWFYAAVSFLNQLIQTFYYFGIENPSEEHNLQKNILMLNVVYFLVLVLMACLLTFKSRSLAQKILGKETYDVSMSFDLNPAMLIEVAVLVMGLVMIGWTLPEFAVRFNQQIVAVQSHTNDAVHVDIPLRIAGVRLFIGIIALFLAHTIGQRLGRERNN